MIVAKVDLYNKISAWVKTITGVSECIKAEQNFTRPEYPYFTIKLSSFAKIGHDSIGNPNDNAERYIQGDREFTLSLQGYGSTTVDKAERINDALEIPAERKLLTDEQIIPFNSNGVLDLSDVVGTEYRERASLDVFVRVASRYIDTIEENALIESVDSVNDIDECGTIKNVNINVSI